ncbi:hypothetical protein ABVG11_30960 [Streptomyces sp. HD1123-B1]|uniref:hypothetical protein n=1 Tax=Streptomyces huangiella TaxID=3228804 RepID=UPI003D7CCA6E
MAAHMKRWISLGTAVTAAVFVMSGCSEAEAKRSTKSPATPTPSRASRPPLTTDQLKALALKDSDVPQAHSVPVRSPEPEADESPASDTSCQEMLDVLGAETASTQVFQIFNWKENIMGGNSVLASYEGDKAREAFRRLRNSLRTCENFALVGPDREFKVTTGTAPSVGDEAIGFHVLAKLPDGGGLRDEHHAFVRTGNVTASFMELNVGQKAKFPEDIIRKQVDRLVRARGR